MKMERCKGKKKGKGFSLFAMVVVLLGAASLCHAAGNYVSDSGTITYSNATGSAIASGSIVDIGNQYAVATVDIATNAIGTIMTKGIWRFPMTMAAADSNAVTIGQALYYFTATNLTSTKTTGTYLGLAATAKPAATQGASVWMHVDLNAPVVVTLESYSLTYTDKTGNTNAVVSVVTNAPPL